MANVLGSLFVELRAETGAFIDGMSKASFEARRASREISESFSKIGEIAERALEPFGAIGAQIAHTFSAISSLGGGAAQSLAGMSGGMSYLAIAGGVAAGAVAAVTGSAIALAVHSAETAAKMNELSQSTGVSVETLSGFAFVAKQTGVEQEAMTKGLEKLSKSIFAAATAAPGTVNAFTRMGISVRDSSGNVRDAGPVMVDIADKLSKMNDGAIKTALSIQLFGKGGAGLVPFLNEGKEGIQELIATAEKLGIVLDAETAEAAHEFTKSMGVLAAAGQGLEIRLMKGLLPALQTVANFLVDGFADKQSALNGVIDGVVWLTKVVIGLGDTFWSVLKTVGIFVGDTLAYFGELAGGIAKSLSAGALFDFRGAERATRESSERLSAIAKGEAADLKKVWSDNAKFINGLFEQIKPGKKPKPGGPSEVDTSAEIKTDPIQKAIDKYTQEATAQLSLAEAAKISTAAIKEQQAANLADRILVHLKDEIAGRADLVAKLKQQEGALRGVISASKLAADVATLGSELARTGDSYQQQIDSLETLGKAYAVGGAAIEASRIEERLAGERQRIAEVTEEISKLDPRMKDYDATLSKLRSDLAAYNDILGEHRLALAEIQQATLRNQVTLQTTTWSAQIPLIRSLNSAYFQNAAAVERAEQALELFTLQQKLSEEGAGASTIQRASALLKEQQDQKHAAQIDEQSQQYNLNFLYDSELQRLKEIKVELERNGQSAMAVDTAIYDLQIKHIADHERQVFQSQNAQILGAAKLYEEQKRLIEEFDQAVASDPFASMADRFRAMVNEIELAGKDFVPKVFGTFSKAIDDASGELAKFIVTGKSGFKELFQSIAEQLLKAQIQQGLAALFGKLFGPPGTSGNGPGGTPPFAAPAKPAGALGGLGAIFGLGGGKGPDGSKTNPLYVIDASGGSGGGLSSLLGGGSSDQSSEGDSGSGSGGGGLGDIFSGLGDKISGTFSSIFSSIQGALGGLASGFGSVFSSYWGNLRRLSGRRRRRFTGQSLHCRRKTSGAICS
jgi:hypothetical protein